MPKLRRKRKRPLPPADPARTCYEVFCPFRNNCPDTAWSCSNVRGCPSRRPQREGGICRS